jgi:hypothetical protein
VERAAGDQGETRRQEGRPSATAAVRSLPMKMAPPSNRFAASRLQVGNGPLAPTGQPRPRPHLAVTTVQICLDHCSENHFYRTI